MSVPGKTVQVRLTICNFSCCLKEIKTFYPSIRPIQSLVEGESVCRLTKSLSPATSKGSCQVRERTVTKHYEKSREMLSVQNIFMCYLFF